METQTSPLADKKYRLRFNKALREKGVPAKACGSCFVVKGHGEFSVRRGVADGRESRCRACAADAYGRWYEANRERRIEVSRRWCEENPERKAETDRRWREENRERAAENGRRWSAENPDRTAETKRRWRRENREKVAETNRRWREANRERGAEYVRRRRARKAAATVTPFTPADLRADWEEHDLYGCFYCGGPAEPLHVDHFYPLNPADEGATPGPHAVDNLVPACETCNTSKGNRDPWAFLSDALAARGVDLDACLAVFDEQQ
ncbi:HNH endonuclease [Streptomyces sp. CBG33]|uniref:HNH endonuclease n=1 Tax=Streptomyces sp. CBG33 TaxID=2762624 RepID=UPI001645D24D|nr:HNH endonuclease signature motif containing protein [Streptomyces sp. CBG33]